MDGDRRGGTDLDFFFFACVGAESPERRSPPAWTDPGLWSIGILFFNFGSVASAQWVLRAFCEDNAPQRKGRIRTAVHRSGRRIPPPPPPAPEGPGHQAVPACRVAGGR